MGLKTITMAWDLCSSPLWVPFYPYTMFQNPIPRPSCQKPRKTIITQKVLVTQSSHIVYCVWHTQKPLWADLQAFSNTFFPVKNVLLNVSLTQRIANSIGNESTSLKVVPWCSHTVDCKWKDMSELVLSENSPYSICTFLVQEYMMRYI